MIDSMKTKFPGPLALYAPQTITLPPPCLTVGRKFLGSSSVFGLRHTLSKPSEQKMLNLLSSVKITLFQNSSGSSTYFRAYSRRFFSFLAEMNGFFLATQPRYPFSRRTFRTVWGLTSMFAFCARLSAIFGALSLGFCQFLAQ